MRVAFLADLHVGNHGRFGGDVVVGLNARCRFVVAALRTACDRAHQLGVEELVVLGDLFDSAQPTPQMLAAVRGALSRECFNQVWLLVGNHEQETTARGDHALAPLDDVDGIRVVDTPRVLALGKQARLVLVPFRPGRATEWLPATVAECLRPERKADRLLLGTHVGIIDDETPHFLRDARDAVKLDLLRDLGEAHNFTAMLAGNWHTRRLWSLDSGTVVMQVGALVPTGFNNPGLDGYGTLAIYDTDTDELSWEQLAGPRFVKVEGLSALCDLIDSEDTSVSCPLFVQAHVNPGDMQAAREMVEQAALTGRAELLPFGAEAEIAARSAATQARSASTLDEALSNFVGEMPLPEGVSRDDVLAKVRDYLGGA
jgi:hypothetical protein